MGHVTDEVYREEPSAGLEGVEVDNRWGPVEVVSASDGSPVHVRAIRTARDRDELEELEVVVERRDSALLVTVDCDSRHIRRGEVEFQIAAPADLYVDVETRAGEISVRGPRHLAALRSSSGRIEAHRINGHLDVETRSGGIDVSGIDGDVDAESSSGSIRVDGRVTGTSSLVSRSGSIEVSGIDGGIDAETSSGRIRLRGRIAGASATSRSGSIDVDGIDGNLAAETSSGRIRVRGRLAGPSLLTSRSGSIEMDLSDDSNVVVQHGRQQETFGDGSGGVVDVDSHGSVRVRRATLASP